MESCGFVCEDFPQENQMYAKMQRPLIEPKISNFLYTVLQNVATHLSEYVLLKFRFETFIQSFSKNTYLKLKKNSKIKTSFFLAFSSVLVFQFCFLFYKLAKNSARVIFRFWLKFHVMLGSDSVLKFRESVRTIQRNIIQIRLNSVSFLFS